MNISILGTGNFGTALGKALMKKHQIIYGSRTPEEKLAWTKTIGEHVLVKTVQEAIDASEVIILALNWPGDTVVATLRGVHSLQGKIIVDATNVLNSDYSPLKFEKAASGAEEIKRLFPSANIVKAFNAASGYTVGNHLLRFGDTTITGFYCGDDHEAKTVVAGLLSDTGFTPLDSGPLKNAQHLESLGQLLISLAFSQGLGVDAGFVFLHRSSSTS